MGFLQGLLGSKKSSQTIASNLTLQSSVYGYPIPIVYGTTRVAPNLIWYGDFLATPVSQGKGGKGSATGGGGKSGGGQYQYQVAVAMGLCEGSTIAIREIYVDKAVTNLAALDMSFFPGTYPQQPWGFLLGSSAPVTANVTVPSSGPYTVASPAGNNLYELASVSILANITLTHIYNSNSPASNQYSTLVVSKGDGLYFGLQYNFNAAQAGQNVRIGYQDIAPSITTVVADIVPSSPPYQLSYYSQFLYGALTDEGVTALQAVPLTLVASSPASGQFSYGANVFTFNAAQASKPVQIAYFPYTGTDALGYNGISYVASSAYQLGESAALPNHNFEIQGIYSNSVPQETNGEQDTIPPSPFAITVEFAAYFIADKGVTDIAGNPFTSVSGVPGNYQYRTGGGVYVFSAENVGIEVNISYTASIGYDADPSLVIADLLSNVHYGAGFPNSSIGSLTLYQAYCIANGLLISPCYNQQQQTSQLLQDIATATNSAFVWSEGVLNLIPYGDQNVSQFGYTYTAPSAPLYNFTDDYLMKCMNPTGTASAAMNSDPIILTRKRPADQINSIKLSCLDRNNSYNVAIIEAKDQALIENFGLRQSASSNSHLFCNIGAGRQSAQLQLQRQGIRNVYSFQLDQRFIYLDPMDIVSINDSYLGLVDQWVRILEITENDDYSLSITAEEFLYGTGSAAVYNFQTGLGYTPNYNADPGSINIPVIFEPTDALGGGLEIWIAASGINTAIWGGCDIYLSTDGETYANVGRIKGAARQGFLSASLPSVTPVAAGQTIDNTNLLTVDLTESNGQLVSGSQTDATNLNTICYVDGEIIAYQNSNLVSANKYTLSYLVRGAYNSTIGAHVAGTQFARLDSGVFQYGYAAPLIGTTVLLKFASFNIWSGGYQSLADIQPYIYIVQGTAFTSALPNVTGFATAYVAGLTQLIWNPVVDFRIVDYEVRQGVTWSSGNFLYRTPLTQGPISGDGTYWISAHYKVPNGGEDIYSGTPVSLTITGSQITQNVIASYDQAALGWHGIFTNTAITSLGLQLTGGGNILADPDYLNTANILFYGGVASSGTYEIPSAERVNIGRVAPCQVIITMGTEVGYSLNAVNVLSLTDYLNASNILGIDLGNNTSATPQVRLSQDGTTWGAWQNWIPGSYSAKAFDAQVILETNDPNVLAVLTDFIFTVDVPTLVQTGTNASIASGGTAITFAHPFNGGPGTSTVPNLQVTILNGSAGDDALVTLKTVNGFTLQIVNGGSGAARTVDWTAEGY